MWLHPITHPNGVLFNTPFLTVLCIMDTCSSPILNTVEPHINYKGHYELRTPSVLWTLVLVP